MYHRQAVDLVFKMDPWSADLATEINSHSLKAETTGTLTLGLSIYPHLSIPNCTPVSQIFTIASNFATLSYIENLHCLHRYKIFNSRLS